MTKLRKTIGTNTKGVMHWCPGCDQAHGIRIEGSPPVWSFDQNWESPTFGPSIRCFTTDDAGVQHTTCHYFIKAGKIQFCGDSPHALKGQTVDIPEWPYAKGSFGGLDE